MRVNSAKMGMAGCSGRKGHELRDSFFFSFSSANSLLSVLLNFAIPLLTRGLGTLDSF